MVRSQLPPPRMGEYMYVIAISNEKGGTGKSTTTLNLAAALAERGRRTLLVDLDPSFGLTRMLGVLPEHFELTLLDVLRQHDPRPIREATQQLKDLQNLFLVPGHTRLAELEVALGQVAWERTLKNALSEVESAYDFCLIDCPPGLGFFPTNAYVAANLILIPIQTEFLALTSLDRMSDFLEGFPEDYRPDAYFLLPTMHDSRTRHAREVVDELRKQAPHRLSKHIIPRTVGFSDSTVEGKPFIHHDPDHEGAKAYRGVAEEILSAWQARNEKVSEPA